MNKFWNYISTAGITMDTSPSEAKRFVLTNQFLILSIIITSFYSFLFGYYGYEKAVVSQIFFILYYIILWFLSHEKHTTLARFLFLVIVNFQIYIACLIFGEASQIHLIYVPVATIPIVLYQSKQKNIIFLFGLFTIVLLFDLFKINFSSVLSTTLSSETVHSFRLTSNTIAIICEVIVVYGLVINSDQAEQKLGKTNILLEDQFKTIFNNSSDALFLVDFESKSILKANNRAIELFEMEKESDFFSHQGSDFQKNKFSENELNDMRKKVLAKGFFENETLYISQKGKEFWGSFAMRLFNVKGERFLTVRITDITENKKNQELIETSLHEKKVLLAEIHHRVKNNLAVISGLLSLQASHIEDEKTKGLFEESRNRIRSMALIHEKLYQNETFANIQMDSYIKDLLNNMRESYNNSNTKIKFSVSSNNNVLDIKHAVPCGLILNELISNACKHAFVGRKTGEIKIELIKKDNKFTMMVSDNGIGYDAETALKKSDTLGLTLINALTEQIDGTLTTTSHKGTTYCITFDV